MDRATSADVLLATLVASALLAAPGAAQDAHYWSQQYGTRSELLGGTVVGSPQDLSTVYYNPGGLPFLETQSFLLSALALEYEKYGLAAAPEGVSELGSDRFGPAPILFTGTLPRSWVDGTLAYSYLTRQRLEARIDAWQPLASGPDAPVANLLVDAKVGESWGGLTWARAYGSVGVGASAYLTYRNQRGREELLSQPIPDEVRGSTTVVINDYSYWHLRTLAKVGVYWARPGASIGATLTTPGVSIAGSGEASYYRSVPTDSAGVDIDEAVVIDRPAVTYRSPVSLAVGSRIDTGSAAIYVTVEWFDGVGAYKVLDAPEVPQDGVGSGLASLLQQELDPVVNLGLGAEYSPRNALTFFGSVITDFSAASADPASQHSFAHWDIFQGTVGAAFSALRTDFTLGLSIAGGGEKVHRQNDLDGAWAVPGGEISYQRWKFFIGLEFRGQPGGDGES